MGTGLAFKESALSASSEEQADYCLGQEQSGIQGFDACMRELERNSNQSGLITLLIIAAVIAAVYFYNKGRSDKDKEAQLRPDSH